MPFDPIALRMLATSAAFALLPATAGAVGPLKCPSDAVLSGTTCIDRWEASVWRVPNPTTTNKALVKKIQNGTATVAQLAAAGATQLGVDGDDYAPCDDAGQRCADDVYALSLPGVSPAGHVTWFQAQAACENARKRLPSNAEWQAAVAGTPDPGPDDGISDCNSAAEVGTDDPVSTGTRAKCRSTRGAFDMVGNVAEWVADWVPRSTDCGRWSAGISATDDDQCLGGAAMAGEPGALLRGGNFAAGTSTGPFAVYGYLAPSASFPEFGFRCAR